MPSGLAALLAIAAVAKPLPTPCLPVHYLPVPIAGQVKGAEATHRPWCCSRSRGLSQPMQHRRGCAWLSRRPSAYAPRACTHLLASPASTAHLLAAARLMPRRLNRPPPPALVPPTASVTSSSSCTSSCTHTHARTHAH